jgi:hypothetical protein
MKTFSANNGENQRNPKNETPRLRKTTGKTLPPEGMEKAEKGPM